MYSRIANIGSDIWSQLLTFGYCSGSAVLFKRYDG